MNENKKLLINSFVYSLMIFFPASDLKRLEIGDCVID